MRRIAKAAMAASLLLTAACGADETVVEVGAGGTHVPGTKSGAVTVPRGEKLVVDFGEQNSSVGDGWFLVELPDSSVLTDEGDHHESGCDQPGCGEIMTWRFGAAAAGTTDLTLQYCYRSRPPDCEPMPGRGPADPVTLTVTVTP